jgi:hypothetical protein
MEVGVPTAALRKHAIGLAFGMAMLSCTAIASAQGDPPFVTDDPDTPGDGHWEINLASTGSRTSTGWDIDALDADINYGWGDTIQLKLEAPWTYVQEPDGSWVSGLGSVNVGVKWRFIDAKDYGFSLSTYPQYLSPWSAYSRKNGIGPTHGQFFLPIEAATSIGGFDFAAEAGRNVVQNGPDEWDAGIVVEHRCVTDRLECLFELHRTAVVHDGQTLFNAGIHWKLSETLIFLAAAGRDFGPSTVDQERFLYYIGFQILR